MSIFHKEIMLFVYFPWTKNTFCQFSMNKNTFCTCSFRNNTFDHFCFQKITVVNVCNNKLIFKNNIFPCIDQKKPFFYMFFFVRVYIGRNTFVIFRVKESGLIFSMAWNSTVISNKMKAPWSFFLLESWCKSEKSSKVSE